MIAIVGAGITGLYLGHLLQEKGIDFRLYEANDHVGGNIRTLERDGYVLETGPNSIRMNADFHGLLQDLNLLDEVMYTAPAAKKRYVLKNGAYRATPSGPISLLFGSFFSFKTVRRILKERRLSPEDIPGETIDAFFRRRFGDDVVDYLVAPFISGIYAGDPKALLVAKAFPQIKKWEREYGSVLKGFFKGRKKSEFKGVFSLRKGLGQMAEAMGQQLGDRLQLGAKLEGLEKENGKWHLELGAEKVAAEKVVLALPAETLAGVLGSVDGEMSAALARVNYPPVSVVQSAYRRSDVPHPLDGFGALHNHLEDSGTLGTIFSSTIFPNRCPSDQILLTTFVGGARTPERAQLTDNGLKKLVKGDYRRFLRIEADPVMTHIVRWPRAIPQYDPDILDAHAGLPRLVEQKIWLAGNWTHGISVPSCLERAQELCEQLLSEAPANSVI